MKRDRAFHYITDAWKPGGTRYEIERWAEWCGLYPKEKRRYQDHVTWAHIGPLMPQLIDGRIAYRLAENECKLLRNCCRQIREKIRNTPRSPGTDAIGGSAEAFEVIRFNLRIAEWAREWLSGKVDSQKLRERFEDVRARKGFPGVNPDYARKLLYLKIVQFAF